MTAPPVALTVRRMRWWDIPAAAAIEREAFPDDAWSQETFWSELAEHATRTYVAADVPGHGLVAYGGIAVLADEADLQTISVAPGHRGRGLGRLLLERLVGAAAGAGARRMHLEVRADNGPALALYESTGWQRCGVRRGYYRHLAAGPVDAVLMTRRLGR